MLMFKVSSRSRIAAAILTVALVAPGAVARAADEPKVLQATTRPADQSEAQMMQQSAQDYRARARYPENSWPTNRDQIRAERITYPNWVTDPDPSAPARAAWAAEVSFEYPAPVILFFKSSVPADSVIGEVVYCESGCDPGEVIGRVEYNDAGLESDRKAGDGIYTARFTVPEERVPDLADSYSVRIKVFVGGQVYWAGCGFNYSDPKAHLTGRYRDSLQDGSLVISAEIVVKEKGRFHLAGVIAAIASGDDEPIGEAQTAAELEPGRYWLHLSFYGLMFHERKAAGPYKLTSLALTTATRMPGAMNAVVYNALTTRAYGLGQMTSKSFGEPNLLEAARRLDAAAAEEARKR